MKQVLFLVLLIAIAIGCGVRSYRYHGSISISELEAIDRQLLDIVYEDECCLPAWVEQVVPASLSRQYSHVVEIEFPFDDLAMVSPDEFASYHSCEFVRTLRISNLTLPQATLDEMLKFPRLEKIAVTPQHHTCHGADSVNLSRFESESVEIVIE
ncbi:MAG: hypothetical protein AAF623_18900 [Planctomycetota bacterium]